MSKSSRRSGRRVPPGGTQAGRTASSGTGSTPSGDASDRTTPRVSTSPTGTARVGRRERPRAYARQSFFERFRSVIVAAVVVVLVVLVGAFVFIGASQPAYACTTLWEPDPTPTPGAGASPRLGYVQPDQGALHGAEPGQKYTLCPPASGRHYEAPRGPIRAGVYGPDDTSVAIPQGWIHNLEHGALVILYRCDDETDACEESGQAAMRQLYASFPDSPICGIPPGTESPVFARFDEMAWPYAALVWGRVLPMDSWDPDLILEFWQREGERTNPERGGCPFPTDSPPPTASPSPTPSSEPSPSAG